MNHVLVLIALFLVSCKTKPYVVENTDIEVKSGAEVFVVSHGWHTGFVMPSKQIRSELPELNKYFGTTKYLEIGWGDRGFYQANEITSKLTMNAIFWPSEAVLHVVAIPDEPAKVFKNSEIKSIHLGKTQYALFLEYLVRSFKKENDKIILLSKGIYGDSRFFLGEGRYYLFNTCNKWTAKGLKSAQYNISTPFKLTAGSVMDSIAQ